VSEAVANIRKLETEILNGTKKKHLANNWLETIHK